MAMSRSFGATLLTTRSPIAISPREIFSSPAIIRSSVDFPQPDGPTRDDEFAVVDIDADPVEHLDGVRMIYRHRGSRQTPSIPPKQTLYQCL